jgi:hypothetical protein
MLEIYEGLYIEFDYVNWRGVKSRRAVVVKGLYYGSTEYHKENQFLMNAIDLHKEADRVFAIRDMSDVKEIIINA